MKNRSNIAASILQNPDLLRNAYETSVNSAGTGMKELDVYTDSVNAKLQQLQNHLQELAAVTIDSQWLKDLIDLGTRAVEVVTWIVDKLGGLNTIIAAIGGVLLQKNGLGLFKKDELGKWVANDFISGFKNALSRTSVKNGISDAIKNIFLSPSKAALEAIDLLSNFDGDVLFKDVIRWDGIKDIKESLKGVSSEVQNLYGGMNQVYLAGAKVSDVIGKLSKETSLLGSIKSAGSNLLMTGLSTVASMGVSLLASMLVSGIITAISNQINKKENIIKAGKIAETNVSQILESGKEREDVIKKAEESYSELRNGVLIANNEIKNINLPEDKFQEFLSLNKDLADSFPNLSTSMTSSGDVIVDLGTKAEETTKQLQKMLDLSKQAEADDVEKELPDVVGKAIEDMKTIEDENKQKDAEKSDLSVFDDILQNGTLGHKYVPIPLKDEDTRRLVKEILESAGIHKTYLPDEKLWHATFGKVIGDVGDLNKEQFSFDVTEDNLQALQEAIVANGRQLSSRAEKYSATVEANIGKIQQNYREKILPSLQSIFEVDPTYSLINKSVDGKLDTLIANLDAYTLLKNFDKQDEFSELQNYILDKFIYPIQNAIDNNKITETEVSDLLNFNYDNLTPDETIKKIQDVTNAIFGADQETREEFLITLGVKTEINGQDESTFSADKIAQETFESIRQNTQLRFDKEIKSLAENNPLDTVWEIPQPKIEWEDGIWDIPKPDVSNISNAFNVEETTSEILDNLPKLDISLEDLQKQLTNEELNTIQEAMGAGAFDFGLKKGEDNLEALRKWIQDYNNAVKNIEDAPTGTLKELLENESFKESASTYETNISTLQTALDNFREAGELTSEQMKDLFGSFENLAKYGDDLTMENIGDEMLKNFNDFYDLFKTTMEDVNLTPEAKIAAQNYIDAFFDQLATVPVSAQTGENAVKDMIVTATGMDAESLGKRSDQLKQYNDIIEALREKYGENIDWGVVLSVLVNTDPAELETNQFINDVETQKATIKIEADLTAAKQDLDKFVEKTESGISAQEAVISAKQAKASSAEFANAMQDALSRGLDPANTVFGNIDTAKRQEIVWNRDTLRQNRDTLKKWGLYDPANMLGTTSTILGMSSSYDDLEIAFSPMLQTDHGAELLTPSTVNKYINSLIKNVMSDHPGGWYTEDLLAKSEDLFALDVEGLEIDGKHIQNLLADIGETARKTGKEMHYVGAVSLAAGEFMPTESDYDSILEGRQAIVDERQKYYEKVLDGYNYAIEHGASEASLDNILKELNAANADLQNANAELLGKQKEAREATLNYYNTLLTQHQAIGENLDSERSIIESNGGVITRELAEQIAANRRSQISTQEAIIRENQRLYDRTGDSSYLQNVTSAMNTASEIRQSGTTARDIMADSRIASLQVAMTELENKANEVQDAITLQEGEGLKPTLKQYNNLINNGEKQIGNLAKQNEQLRIQQRSLVNNGKVLEANKGRWRTIRNQIAANNSAIAKMNANLKNWQMSLKSMGGDLGNSMLSALQAAFDEAISPTGLQYNTMKELAAQFEGVEGFDFADIFYNTANGVKLDADATQRVVDAKYGLVTDEIKKRIEAQTESLNGLKEQYNATEDAAKKLNIAAQMDIKQEGLDNLYNQLAQYQAFYGEAQKLFTGYGDWSRALQTANAGDTYNEIRDYLKTQEENFEQGLIGTDDFKTFTAMYDEWGRNTQAAYIKNREQMKQYLTEDATGMANFFNDLVTTGYAQKTGEASWHLNDITNTAEAAHAMGMSEEFLTYMLGKSEDYGFHIDYVKDQIDGELKIQEAIHETADLIERRNELIAQGAPQEAIDEANAQINELDERIVNLRENTQDVTARAGKVTAQEIKAAVDTIDQLKERYDNAVSDQERNVLRQEIENAAEEFGIVIKPDLTYEMPEQYAGYEQALVAPDYKKAAEVTADEIKAITTMYGEDGNLAAWAPDYQSAINKIGESWEANKEEAQKYLDVLKFADVGALKTIDLDDGQTIAGMEREEEALDGLKTLFGLTNEEAKNLVAVLDQVGLVGALAGTEAAEGLQTLFNVAGQGGTLDVDMSQLETYINEHKDDFEQMSTIDLQFNPASLDDTQIQEKLGLINEMKAEVDVETEGGEEAMQTLNEVEEICKDEQNFRTKVDFILDESGLTKDEFLELTTEEQAGITHKVGIEPETEDFDRFLEYVQNNTIEQRIQAVLDSDSSKTLEDWIKLGEDEDKREEFKLYFGIETDEEYDTTMAELKKREAEGFDTKVALNSTSIEGIGEAIGKELSNIDINVNKENVDKGNSALQTMINKIDEINKKRINLKTNDSAIGVKPISQTDDGGVKRSVTSSVQQAKSIAGSGVNVPIKANTSSLKAIKSGIDNVRNSTNTPINLRVNSETVRAALLNVLKQIDTVRKNAERGITLGVKTGDSITKIEELQTTIEAAKNTLLGGIAVRAEVKGKDKVDELKQAIDNLYGKTVSIHEYGAEESTKRVNDLKAAIDALYGKTVYVAEFGAADSYNRVFDLREEIDRLTDKTVTVTTRNVTINETRDIHTDGGGLTATATGTLTSIGMAYAKGTIGEDGKVTKSGSAYNVYNYKDAKAKGDVGVNKDQDALVNELGHESLIRNGRWLLIPGGPHVEHLKKGDIVFSHKQTSDLLKSGKTTGHARVVGGQAAFAKGTTNGMPAFLRGNLDKLNGVNVDGDNNTINIGNGTIESRGKGSVNGYGTLYTGGKEGVYTAPQDDDKDDDVSDGGGNDGGGDDTLDDGKDTPQFSQEVFDYVELRLQYFADATKKIADKITEYIDDITKEKYLKEEINALKDEISANSQAAISYSDFGEKEAKAYTYTDDDGNRQTVNVFDVFNMEELLNGKIGYEDLKYYETTNPDQKAYVEGARAYLDYINKAREANSAVQTLTNTMRDLYSQIVQLPTQKLEKALEKIENRISTITSASSSITGSGGLRTLRKYLAQITSTKDTEKELKNAKKAAAKADKAQAKAQSAYDKKEAARDTAASRVLGNKNYKRLSNKQQNLIESALFNRRQIDVSKLKSLGGGLTGDIIRKINDYNLKAKQANTASNKLDSAQAKVVAAQNALEEAVENNTIAQNRNTASMEVVRNSSDKTPAWQVKNELLDANLAEKQNELTEQLTRQEEREQNQHLLRENRENAESQLQTLSSSLLSNFGGLDEWESVVRNAIENKTTIDATGLPRNVQALVGAWNTAVATYQTADSAMTENAGEIEKYGEKLQQAAAEVNQVEQQNAQQKLDNIAAAYDINENLLQAYASSIQKLRTYNESYGITSGWIGDFSFNYDQERENLSKRMDNRLEEIRKLEDQLWENVNVTGTWTPDDDEYKAAKAKIEAYQNEVADIRNAYQETFSQMFQSITSWYDAAIGLQNSFQNYVNKVRTNWENYGLTGGNGDLYRQQYDKEAELQRTTQQMYLQNARQLEKELEERVRDSDIHIGDKQYNQLASQIQEQYNKAEEINASLHQLYTQMFQSIAAWYDSSIKYLSSINSKNAKTRELWSTRGTTTQQGDYRTGQTTIQGISFQRDRYGNARSTIQDGSSIDLIKKSYEYDIQYARQTARLRQKEADEMQKQLNNLLATGQVKRGTKDFFDLQSQINDLNSEAVECEINIEKLYDSMLEDVYFKPLDKAIKQLNELRNTLQSIEGLISDEMMFTEEGAFTELGQVKYTMDTRSFKNAQDELDTIQTAIAELNRLYKNGNFNMSVEEYQTKLKEYQDQAVSAMQAASQARQSIIKDVTDRYETELKYINKLIDARKKELEKRKQMYEYDKGLKKSNKEIQLIEQQIRALEGLTDAESKSQKARLEAQRKELQEQLDDEVKSHVTDMRIEGLDTLQENLQEGYDKYVKELATSLDTSSNLVSDSANNLSKTLDTTNNALTAYLRVFSKDVDMSGTLGLDRFTEDNTTNINQSSATNRNLAGYSYDDLAHLPYIENVDYRSEAPTYDNYLKDNPAFNDRNVTYEDMVRGYLLGIYRDVDMLVQEDGEDSLVSELEKIRRQGLLVRDYDDEDGWLVEEYAKGTTHAKGGMSKVFEEGPETIVTDHGIYIPLKAGDGVIPTQMTENLMNMARGVAPMGTPEFKLPNIDINSGSQNVNVHYDSLINIEGNVDQGVVNQLQDIVKGLTNNNDFKQSMYKYTAKQMAKDMRKAGY